MLFYGDNHIGVVREWWMHTPSSYWFIVERHNQTDEVIRTYDPAELFDADAAPTASRGAIRDGRLPLPYGSRIKQDAPVTRVLTGANCPP